MKKKEVAVKLFRHLCEHDWHGYSQYGRWGDGEGTCDVVIDGVTYKLEQGDRDCSSAVISAFEAAGINCGGATYTGNMRSCMIATGNFVWRPMSYIAQAGDVYLNEINHTAMCMSAVPDMLGEFSISETGGIHGATGDQTGRESYIHEYYDYPWDGILQCVNEEVVGFTDTERIYVVKPGDSLYRIAITHNTCWYKIANDNGLANPDLIYPGQKLIIK